VEKGVGENIDLYSFEEVAEYSAQDSRVTWDLWVFLESRFTQRRAQALRDLEMSVLEPVLEMEAEGTRIDVPRLTEIGDALRTDTDVAHRNAVREAGPIEGKPFNIGSNPQKQQVLYGKRRLKPTKLTPSGKKRAKKGEALSISDYSVDAEALADLGHDTLVQHIQTYQSKSKLLSTYIDPYLGEESRLEGNRIHTSFNQTGAESGRFSSSGPNLQNIPNRSEDGRRLREVFVSDEGETLVVADYSQIEPRIIASLAGDKTMTDTYYDGGDVYQVVADRLSVSRPVGKELVLSIAYGVGPAKISARTGLGVLEARELLHFFAQEFSAVPKHKAAVINKARRMKYAETVLGRRRPLPAFRSRSRDEVSKAERQAYNHRIQGSAADVMKMALVGIYDNLPPEARLLMTVHDEVVVSAPEDMADEVGDIVKKQMEAVDLFTVPLVAEVGSGHRWSEAH
jgi:DNA polymerase-1